MKVKFNHFEIFKIVINVVYITAGIAVLVMCVLTGLSETFPNY